MNSTNIIKSFLNKQQNIFSGLLHCVRKDNFKFRHSELVSESPFEVPEINSVVPLLPPLLLVCMITELPFTVGLTSHNLYIPCGHSINLTGEQVSQTILCVPL